MLSKKFFSEKSAVQPEPGQDRSNPSPAKTVLPPGGRKKLRPETEGGSPAERVLPSSPEEKVSKLPCPPQNKTKMIDPFRGEPRQKWKLHAVVRSGDWNAKESKNQAHAECLRPGMSSDD